MNAQLVTVICDGGCAPTAISAVDAEDGLPPGWVAAPAVLTERLRQRGWTAEGIARRKTLHLCPECQ